MKVRRKQRSEVTGMRLAPDARKLLDREVERTGRFPAQIVGDLIRLHLNLDSSKDAKLHETSTAERRSQVGPR